jgi:hypothetical protein
LRSVLSTLVSGMASTTRTSRGYFAALMRSLVNSTGRRRRGAAGRERHERDDLLADLRVRPADDGAAVTLGVREQDVLDVARVDVEAVADDEVLDAVDDVEVAVLVEVADVAGVEPAVADACSVASGACQ